MGDDIGDRRPLLPHWAAGTGGGDGGGSRGRGVGLHSKWAATLASVWIQCTSGSGYCFSVYSPLLKSSQGYDQSTLATVAFFKDLGTNAGTLAGVLYSRTASPRAVLAAGAAQCFLGYFFMWLAVAGALPGPLPVPLMCVFMLLAAHGLTFFNTANVVSAVHNFPRQRGTIVGIMKGFVGLSGAILIQVYQTVYPGRPSHFLLMIAVLPTLLPIVLMYFVRVYHSVGKDDKRVLNVFSTVAVIVAGYLMCLIISEKVHTLSRPVRVLTFVVLLLLLASPLSVVRNNMKDTEGLYENLTHEPGQLIAQSEVRDSQKVEILTARLGSSMKGQNIPRVDNASASSEDLYQFPARGQDLNIQLALRTADFWLLFIAMAFGMGSGLATVNNISQIGASRGYSSVETSTLVSLWSIWNFLGRFGAGFISDYCFRVLGCARPLLMVITLATMSLGHAIISSGIAGGLYVGSVLVGVCYGSQWSLMPIITSEIFGMKHFGAIFNTISIASPLGSYIFSVRIVGYLYDMEAAKSDTKACVGAHCFMLSFLIMASASLFGSLIAFILFLRTRSFYKQVLFEKL